MRRYAICAQVRGRTSQKYVLNLLPRQCRLMKEDGFHEFDFGVHQVRTSYLGGVEIRQKAKCVPDRPKSRKVLLLERRTVQMGHIAPPAALQVFTCGAIAPE